MNDMNEYYTKLTGKKQFNVENETEINSFFLSMIKSCKEEAEKKEVSSESEYSLMSQNSNKDHSISIKSISKYSRSSES